MYLFLSEIYGAESAESFANLLYRELLPSLRGEEIIASGWAEHEAEDQLVIQGWSEKPPAEVLSASCARLGWDAVTRVFYSIGGVGLPPSTATVVVCEMPNNLEQINSTQAKQCPAGHVFEDNHNILNCVLCGQALT